MTAGTTAVLEVGGTHASSALVTWDHGGGPTVHGGVRRRPVDGAAPADELLDAMAEPLAAVLSGCAPGVGLAVALPGPFDYENGIGDYRGVDKFGSLSGVDVRDALAERVGHPARDIRFVNDAVAFAVGEQASGAGAGRGRSVFLTLGTGVGSAFMVGPVVLTAGPGVPPDGRMDLVHVAGRPLERLVSRAAIRRSYVGLAGDGHAATPAVPDLAEIFALAREGDGAATTAVGDALGALAGALGPLLRVFRPDAVVVGGSVARSWDVVAPLLRRGLAVEGVHSVLVPSVLGEDGPLLGAAVHARRLHERPR